MSDIGRFSSLMGNVRRDMAGLESLAAQLQARPVPMPPGLASAMQPPNVQAMVDAAVAARLGALQPAAQPPSPTPPAPSAAPPSNPLAALGQLKGLALPMLGMLLTEEDQMWLSKHHAQGAWDGSFLTSDSCKECLALLVGAYRDYTTKG